MFLTLLIFGAASMAEAQAERPLLRFSESAEVHSHRIVVADVAGLAAVPERFRQRVGAVPVAMLRPGQTETVVRHRRLAELVRAAVPAAAAWLPPAEGEVLVRYIGSDGREGGEDVPRANVRTCFRLLHSITMGTVPARRDFAPASCGGEEAAAFRYDAPTRTMRATRNLEEGQTVPALPERLLPDIRPGDTLHLAVRVGPVVVQREVVAIQPGWSGETLFVKTGSGELLSALSQGASQ